MQQAAIHQQQHKQQKHKLPETPRRNTQEKHPGGKPNNTPKVREFRNLPYF
jgi:hypothetical protein